MAVPKKRISKSKRGMRRAHLGRSNSQPSLAVCAQCGAPSLPHRVCLACGYYRSVEVIKMDEF